MALIFADGFGNYGTVLDFWDVANGSVIITTPGTPRTGRGCLQIVEIFAHGPSKTFSQLTHVLQCTACNLGASGEVLRFNTDGYVGVQVIVNADRSIKFAWGGNTTLIGTTAPGLVTFNSYVSIAVEIQNFTPSTGIITCWVNGVQVFHQTGCHTNAGDNVFPRPNYCNEVQLMGASPSSANTYHADFYCLDCSTAPNNTFLGALKLYSIPPTANGTVAWAPLAGTNWSEVNEVPPDGDTSYNSSGNIGDVDQYVYPLTGPPANSSLLFVQHELDMKVDSGSRSVASDVAGLVNASATALSNGYHIYPTPYDVNPSTGLPWVAGDFPVNAGPAVTA